MCGICGEVGFRTSRRRVTAATGRMVHRGPDQCGIVRAAGAVLGHRRLSVIDLSPAAGQPMANEDGSVLLVFNGEIYNFQVLRDLLKPNHAFRSRADSEVLVHGYEQWGFEGLLDRIRGAFAFAIWDQPRQTLFLARDHLGKKPVFYSYQDGRLAFASTIPALLELLGTTPSLSPTAIVDYLNLKYVPAPSTIFAGVSQLTPASYLTYSVESGPEVRRYWHLDFSRKVAQQEDEWLELLCVELRRAVSQRLVADVPVGAFLSGGVDSSIVAALMTRASSRPPITISMRFDDPGFDESVHARSVAAHLGTEHHECSMHASALDIAPEIVAHFGQPFADMAAVPTYYLARFASRHLKAVLTGDGGDEVFAGYPTAAAAALAGWVRAWPGARSGRLAEALHRMPGRDRAAIRQARWIAELARGANGRYLPDPLGKGTFAQYGFVLAPFLKQAINGHDWTSAYRKPWSEVARLPWADRALYTDLLTALPNDFLPKLDTMTMAHSVEARCPFLDVELVEIAASIPWSLKLRGFRTKYLLKRLGERLLPHGVLHRAKHGFLVPTGDWLRTELRHLGRALLLSEPARRRALFDPTAVARLLAEHESGAAEHGQRLWSLIVLELWCRMVVDRDILASDTLTDVAADPVRSQA